ncbi:MAG: AAA family ATPase [Candidatus Aenigmatarchaeota archaeon]|nr:MAG: AAA family ATPase [Candidatus Aenigmarchaeota archaeon]
MEIERYLVEKKEEIRGFEVKKRLVKFPVTKFGTAVIGPRRSGKSFSLFSLIKDKKIKDEDYIFVNYEDDEIKTLERTKKIRVVDAHIELYRKPPRYIFLDEIHALERWQSFVYSLIEKKKYYVFITGSSSKLLSKEIATQLRGRIISVPVFPFSFKEYLSLKEAVPSFPLSSSAISNLKGFLREYLLSTGFPPVIIDKMNPKVFFKDYVNLVIFRDIVERFRVKNIYALKFLINRIISSFSAKFSVNKVFNELKARNIKVGKAMLYDYADHLDDVMFSFFLKKFYFSEKKSALSVPKAYLCDLGLANYLIGTKFSEDIGRAMENIVSIELKKKELGGEIDLFYWESHNCEVDFVVKEGLRIKQLIQVTYASSIDEIEKRELRALLKASKELNCKNLLCITWDYEGIESLKSRGLERKIRFVPLWKWLLSPSD